MKKKKLLFIEDDVVTGQVYQFHFSSAGNEALRFNDGENGMKAVRKLNPDIVVLDLMLPRLNGLEIIQQIRANPETKLLPVVVFTNGFDQSAVKAAESAGADKCLIKAQTTPERLLAAIAAALHPTDPGTAGLTKSSVTAAETTRPPDARAEFLRSTPKVLAELRHLIQQSLATADESIRRQYARDATGDPTFGNPLSQFLYAGAGSVG